MYLENNLDLELDEFRDILNQIEVHQSAIKKLRENLNEIKDDPKKRNLYKERQTIYKHEFVVLKELFENLSRRSDLKIFELKRILILEKEL